MVWKFCLVGSEFGECSGLLFLFGGMQWLFSLVKRFSILRCGELVSLWLIFGLLMLFFFIELSIRFNDCWFQLWLKMCRLQGMNFFCSLVRQWLILWVSRLLLVVLKLMLCIVSMLVIEVFSLVFRFNVIICLCIVWVVCVFSDLEEVVLKFLIIWCSVSNWLQSGVDVSGGVRWLMIMVSLWCLVCVFLLMLLMMYGQMLGRLLVIRFGQLLVVRLIVLLGRNLQVEWWLIWIMVLVLNWLCSQ